MPQSSTFTCADCRCLLEPIQLDHPVTYTANPVDRISVGVTPPLGTVRAGMCPQCRRILLFGVPVEVSLPASIPSEPEAPPTPPAPRPRRRPIADRPPVLDPIDPPVPLPQQLAEVEEIAGPWMVMYEGVGNRYFATEEAAEHEARRLLSSHADGRVFVHGPVRKYRVLP